MVASSQRVAVQQVWKVQSDSALGRHYSLGERKQRCQPGQLFLVHAETCGLFTALEWRSDGKKPGIFVVTPRDFVQWHHRQMSSVYYDLFVAWRGS
jgi:hypothetical protein